MDAYRKELRKWGIRLFMLYMASSMVYNIVRDENVHHPFDEFFELSPTIAPLSSVNRCRLNKFKHFLTKRITNARNSVPDGIARPKLLRT